MNDAISAGVPRNPSLMALRTIHRLNRMLPAMAQYRSHDLTLLTPCPRYGDQHQSEQCFYGLGNPPRISTRIMLASV